MTKHLLLLVGVWGLSLFSHPAWAQLAADAIARKYAETIQESDLKKHLFIIAADSMEGRYTGSQGQKKAAKYIANHFEQLGLTPPVADGNAKSYFQPFQMVERRIDNATMSIGNEAKTFLKDFYVLNYSAMNTPTSLPVVFAGQGEAQDFAELQAQGVSLQGKAVVCFKSKTTADEKAKQARRLGAQTLIIIIGNSQKEFDEDVSFNAYYIKKATKQLVQKTPPEQSIFFVSHPTAAQLLGIEASNLTEKLTIGTSAAAPVELSVNLQDKLIWSSENVVGLMEGTDKKDEYVIITAHYDHVGITNGVVYNGADDDGSGTVSVLEIAEAFAQAKAEGNGPRRSVVFMTVAGEEIGLFGSQFYTDVEPIFPLENTVVDLNIDMVGRIDDKYKKLNNPNYIYLIGSDKLSSTLHQLSEEVNQTYTT